MNSMPASTLERIRRYLVGLRMPRALETLDATLNRVRLAPNGMRYAVQVRPVAPWPDGKAVTQNFCLERWPRKFGQSDKWFGRGLSRR